MANLHIKAGPVALELLRKRGKFHHEDVKVIPAAAGGPKWLMLYELDKFIFGDWLKESKQPIHLIGASAGAWRMACAAQESPIPAFNKLFKYYVEQSYPVMPSPQEVSDKCADIIKKSLGTAGISDILKSTNRILHVITSKAKFNYQEDKMKSILFKTLLVNTFSRKKLDRYFERNVFSSGPQIIDKHFDNLPTIEHQLNKTNLLPVLRASGAIPTVISPISNIASSPGTHWDGGLTDYHIDLPYKIDQGIIFYPHFANQIIPGWMDKFLPWRKALKKNLERMVLIYPSDEFIKSLPFGRISDRKDFNRFFQKDEERIAYWKELSDQCKVLATEFKEMVDYKINFNVVSSF